jgi:hypothetical protein
VQRENEIHAQVENGFECHADTFKVPSTLDLAKNKGE